jgi:hypothetical protein
MAKAQIVEYSCKVGSHDACSGAQSDEEKFYLLETLGERPLIIVRWDQHILVSPSAREGRDEALNYNFHHVSAVGSILAGARRVIKEVEISDEQVAHMLRHLESIKLVEEAREYLAKVLQEEQPGPSYGSGRHMF